MGWNLHAIWTCKDTQEHIQERNLFTVNQHFPEIYMKTHTGEKLFQYEICQSTFSQNSSLIKHIRTYTREKTFQCDECQSIFSRNSDLIKQIRIHFSEKPFHCDICEIAFTQKSHVSIHMWTHTEENPSNVKFVDQHFHNHQFKSQYVQTHSKMKHFYCDICESKFSLKKFNKTCKCAQVKNLSSVQFADQNLQKIQVWKHTW